MSDRTETVAVLAVLSGADATAVSNILSDAVEVYLLIAVVVMISLVILRLPR